MRLLIVDDEEIQLTSLARVVAAMRNDITVLTAADGVEATEVLSSRAVDVVLTDLQMPRMHGLDLIAWIISHQPHVSVMTMTAYPDAEAMRQLAEAGDIECFTKPLNVPRVLERMKEVAEAGVRGHVQNLSLSSLLQIVELEAKTCTLIVETGDRVGHLYIRHGSLVHAQCFELSGVEAAYEILAWESPSITIVGTCAVSATSVQGSLSYIILEALRLQDESAHIAKRSQSEEAAPPFDLNGLIARSELAYEGTLDDVLLAYLAFPPHS